MLMTQIKPGSVVLFHDTYSSTVALVYQFIPVLKANGYRLVTVSQMLGPRAPGSSYSGRDDPDAAEHAVPQADAQPTDHRHPQPEPQRECSPTLTTHESFCSPRPSASAGLHTVYSRALSFPELCCERHLTDLRVRRTPFDSANESFHLKL
jgi:hypothetical protein